MVNFFPILFHTFCQLLFIILLFYVPYTSPRNRPQAKRQCLPPGFQLSHPVPSSSQESSSLSSSLFVTVSASACRCGNLTTGNHLLPSCQNGRTLHKKDLEPNDNAYLLDFSLLVQSFLVHKNLLHHPLCCLSQSVPALADVAI